MTALRTGAAWDNSRAIEETYDVPILSPGAFRVTAVIVEPDGSRRPLTLRHQHNLQEVTETELRWTDGEPYREGGKILYVIVNPAR